MSKRFKEIVSVKDAYIKACNNKPMQDSKKQEANTVKVECTKIINEVETKEAISDDLKDEDDYIKVESNNQQFALLKDLEFSPEDFTVKKEERKNQKTESDEDDFFNLSDLNMSFAGKI